MNNEFSQDSQKEIEDILKQMQYWSDFFYINIEYYIDGWAIFLREKNLYPRCIVVFKSYLNLHYSIKSFEVQLQNYKKEKFIELYSVENIRSQEHLFCELKEIIYGKDLGNHVLRMCDDTFS